MASEGEFFSLQIVTADFYMVKPKSGLDPCFSEFRAKEIKKVPIIRIFGSNSTGEKTCMHVHGVFPYLYIPYDKNDFESLDRAIYLVASSIDKAINISLGQANSDCLHVFKIQLVKGLPMYGYHRKEHQYLKIYMLNPRFIKRTANLLQNGAILGKMFQPHESHVHYILQFFIDYNLFGMSFIHVPKDVIRFRRNNDLSSEIRQESDLNSLLEKQSTCKLEVDISSAFILNRFQIGISTGSNSNPGIEAIWQDERIRRQQLSTEYEEIPPIEVPPSQDREGVKQTESELYFLTVLKHKLNELEQSPDLSLNALMQSNVVPEHVQRKKTFNLTKLIANAVYPEECNEGFELTNASFIEDHTSNKSMLLSKSLSDKSNVDSIVDEQLVLSLTQPDLANQSLREQDMELLDVMQELENQEYVDTIDLDSTLAPLSACHEFNNSQKLSKELGDANYPGPRGEDSDDEALNDFTLIIDDVDEVLSKLSQLGQSQSADKKTLDQLDGANDTPSTPKKSKPRGEEQGTPKTPGTPKRNMIRTCHPRTPKTPNSVAKKYTPLPLTIHSRAQKGDVGITGANSIRKGYNKSEGNLKPESRTRKKRVDLEKTHISCNLKSAFRQTEKRLKVYKSHKKGDADCQSVSNEDVLEKCDLDDENKMREVEEMKLTQRRESRRIRSTKIKTRFVGKQGKTEEDKKTQIKNSPVSTRKSVTNGNEHFTKKLRVRVRKLHITHEKIKENRSEGTNFDQSEESENVANKSTPIEFVVSGQSNTVKHSECFNASNSRHVIITPLVKPETYEEVLKNCKAYDIADVIHKHPFYSNYADVTQKKEVGHTVLSIRSKSMMDVEDFHSSIPNLKGLNEHMRDAVASFGSNVCSNNGIRDILSTEENIIIRPLKLPPTQADINVFLKSRDEKLPEEEDDLDGSQCHFEEDSPIKVKRRKVVMLMEGTQSDDDLDCSTQNLTLTPMTPISTTKTQLSQVETDVEKNTRSVSAKACLSQKLDLISMSNISPTCGHPKELATSDTSDKTLWPELERSSIINNLKEFRNSLETSFGISIATLNNTYGFKLKLENLQQAKSDMKLNDLTILSLEVFVSTREDYLPNPEFDALDCIFYAIESNFVPISPKNVPKMSGCIAVLKEQTNNLSYGEDVEVQIVNSETEAFMKLLELVETWDPDIFVGYEVEMSSWGYIIDRSKYLKLNIAPSLSRVPSQKTHDFVDEDRDTLTDLDTDTKFCGRILLDVWRLMRSEIALTSYTFENVMYHVMHRRCPLHKNNKLTAWFQEPQTRWIVLDYYFNRVRGILELLNQLDLIGRTSEMAKLIGIQFYEVLSRGSQFRVESMMLRIAKPNNFVPLSPSVLQRAHMRAPEYLPLILEPESRFYPDPVIVLDFQSLYPSMIMAYNYCFTTCLGRVEHLGQSLPFEFGASQLRVSTNLIKELLDNDMVTISPCGAVFVKRKIREGILPRMLSEVLDTRQMVKQSMKLHKNNTALQRILHSRQLGLKLIANVTYGYTAANFSGRMPCVEVGDSVVSKGRETLERAIKLVERNKEWNVKVVYGDTDSLFVQVPGRTREEAFRIGAEIAHQVTQDNPQPVKLKLEKVYQPCILQTKKRYVGYMYETPEQMEPVFEAKGIETVRRDGCPAAAKMLEKSLKILFNTCDVSLVKNYVCRQFTKLLCGKANIQDLIFAKEFRGLNGYKPTACVPALELTRKWIQTDPRKIPRRGERVPFVVTSGPPGLPLIKLVRSPYDVLEDEGLQINAIYYITKAIIPPLNRCLLLVGADVNEWFMKLPRRILLTQAISSGGEVVTSNFAKRSTISQYFSSTNCLIDCGQQTLQGICSDCSLDSMRCLVTLEEKISKLQRGYHLTRMICQVCCGRLCFTNCISLDCPVLFMLEVKRRELNRINHIHQYLQLDFL